MTARTMTRTTLRTTLRTAIAALSVVAAAATVAVSSSPARAGTAGGVIGATKSVLGSFTPGGTVTYTIVVSNTGLGAQTDNPGNELTDVLPSSLALVSAAATSGTAVATIATNTVTWNGVIPAGASVTLTVTATIGGAVAAGTAISNQATISYDLDNNGTNESNDTSDDPNVAGLNNPTTFIVIDTIDPTVMAAPAAAQPNPTTDSPILFDVVFSEPVTGFSAAGIVLGGTAGPTTAMVSGSGTTYQVSVSGMTAAGTVTVAVSAAAAVDGNENPNAASDVSAAVQFNIVVPPTTTTTTSTTTVAPETTTTTTTPMVTPAPTAPPATSGPANVALPETGSSSSAPIAIVALVLVLAGGVLLLLRRRPSSR